MNPIRHACAPQQHRVRRHVESSDAYTFFNLLTGPQLLDEVESLLPDHRERLFPPTETLSMFLAQALGTDRSCQSAVNDSAVQRLSGGLPLCSTHTGGYCRARQRLPTAMLSALTQHTGGLIAARTPAAWYCAAGPCVWWTAPPYRCRTRRPIKPPIRNRAANNPAWVFRCADWSASCAWAAARC